MLSLTDTELWLSVGEIEETVGAVKSAGVNPLDFVVTTHSIACSIFYSFLNSSFVSCSNCEIVNGSSVNVLFELELMGEEDILNYHYHY